MAATRATSTLAERDGGVNEPALSPPEVVPEIPTAADEPRLDVGTAVEVRRRFDRAWARGFVVEAHGAAGYHLRRSSDGAVLPVAFPAPDVRPAPQA